MTDTITPERRQRAALAALSTPVLQRAGFRPGRETRRLTDVAEAMATLEGSATTYEWARENFRTRGVRR